MSLKCGIVGLPNVGKSTLFNALTKAGIEAANYPFCTIEPNVGIVEVPDARMHFFQHARHRTEGVGPHFAQGAGQAFYATEVHTATGIQVVIDAGAFKNM